MRNLKKILGVLLVIILVNVPLVASAGEQMVFAEKFVKSIRSGRTPFRKLAPVKFNVPADGFVVVTASGMALFDSDLSDLTLTLHKKAATRGPWVYTVNPGVQLSQAFTVRHVFPVSAGGNPTFFLNGASANGPGGFIDIQTGSITVEFYASANVQSAAPGNSVNAPSSKDLRSNAP
jgi:hypothetical protein